MKLPMVSPAKWYGEFIAHLETNCPRLRKAQVMRIRRLPPANQARLRSHEFQVGLISQSFRFGDSELAPVDFGRGDAGAAGANGGALSLFASA